MLEGYYEKQYNRNSLEKNLKSLCQKGLDYIPGRDYYVLNYQKYSNKVQLHKTLLLLHLIALQLYKNLRKTFSDIFT